MNKKHVVMLTDAERRSLRGLVSTGREALDVAAAGWADGTRIIVSCDEGGCHKRCGWRTV